MRKKNFHRPVFEQGGPMCKIQYDTCIQGGPKKLNFAITLKLDVCSTKLDECSDSAEILYPGAFRVTDED